MASSAGLPVRLSIYDFDGTLLQGKSPVILTRSLLKQGRLAKGNVGLIALWGLAYKMHVPPNEAWVRGRVFRAFEGKPKEEVDAFLRSFFDEKIGPRVRPTLLRRIQAEREEGCIIGTVSATFEPFMQRMVELGWVDFQVSTKMAVDDEGRYLAYVDGAPVEGEEKLAALTSYADERFGAGNWTIAHAYSDHYSDRPLLYAATNATAVHPDHGLMETARRNGWEILDY